MMRRARFCMCRRAIWLIFGRGPKLPSAKRGTPICTPPAIACNSFGGRNKMRLINAYVVLTARMHHGFGFPLIRASTSRQRSLPGLKGHHKSAQGRAKRQQPRSVALGPRALRFPALLRATQTVLIEIVLPLTGRTSPTLHTQGGARRRASPGLVCCAHSGQKKAIYGDFSAMRHSRSCTFQRAIWLISGSGARLPSAKRGTPIFTPPAIANKSLGGQIKAGRRD